MTEHQFDQMQREADVMTEYGTGEREYPVTKKEVVDDCADTLEEANS